MTTKSTSKIKKKLMKARKKLESWCTLNNMKLNAKKCSLVVFKSEMSATLQNQEVTRSCLRRDLDLLVSNSMSWTENCTTRSSKSLRALFKIRRNVSPHCNTQLKILAYTGYVMPILTFCSEAYYPSVSSLKKLEKIQKHAEFGSTGTLTTTKQGYFAAISYHYPFTLNCLMYFTCKWYLTALLI